MDSNILKKKVAEAAIEYIRPQLESDMIIGIGTGSTANHFIDLLAPLAHLFKGAVASSEGSMERLKKNNIAVFDLNEVASLPFYIDGADEATRHLHLVKGGGAALTREKIVAAVAKQFICIADESKYVDTLGAFPLPVEVIPMARSHAGRELVKLGGSPSYRQGVVTDNGNIILDVYHMDLENPECMEESINQIVGVVTNGLFARRPADVLLLGKTSGVEVIRRDDSSHDK